MRFLVVGEPGVGKTTLVEKYHGQHDLIDSSIELNNLKESDLESYDAVLLVCDTRQVTTDKVGEWSRKISQLNPDLDVALVMNKMDEGLDYSDPQALSKLEARRIANPSDTRSPFLAELSEMKLFQTSAVRDPDPDAPIKEDFKPLSELDFVLNNTEAFERLPFQEQPLAQETKATETQAISPEKPRSLFGTVAAWLANLWSEIKSRLGIKKVKQPAETKEDTPELSGSIYAGPDPRQLKKETDEAEYESLFAEANKASKEAVGDTLKYEFGPKQSQAGRTLPSTGELSKAKLKVVIDSQAKFTSALKGGLGDVIEQVSGENFEGFWSYLQQQYTDRQSDESQIRALMDLSEGTGKYTLGMDEFGIAQHQSLEDLEACQTKLAECIRGYQEAQSQAAPGN